jgi:xanthine dehydrogenase YagT iron-sulfur-binding subunit
MSTHLRMGRASDEPVVGAQAPELAVRELAVRPVSAAWHSEPRVLAFVDRAALEPDTAAAPEVVAAIRAQLRGLGAELVVLSPAGGWWVRADDAIEPLGAEDMAPAAAAYDVAEGEAAVFVIDGRGVVRFMVRPALGAQPMWVALADALSIAGQAVHARASHGVKERLLFTRREWSVTCLVVGCAAAFLAACKEQSRRRVEKGPAPPPEETPPDLDVTLTVNGKKHALKIDPRASLLDTLRERLGLTGTKKGCDMGQCGACTVLYGGKRINACLTLAVMAQARDITTIEGLAKGDVLHPMQQAFVDHDGLQCGYCTPGQIMSAVGLVGEGRAATDAEIREQMSGNICRCGAYPNIVAAIQAARRTRG